MRAKPSTEKIPKEYAAFKKLLRQVVKVEQKPASAPSSSGKG
jgi:hypothetical protein